MKICNNVRDFYSMDDAKDNHSSVCRQFEKEYENKRKEYHGIKTKKTAQNINVDNIKIMQLITLYICIMTTSSVQYMCLCI